MTNFYVNVAIVGLVSVGKSTFLNALFGETYSDMKMKRTTMIPQIYIEVNDTIKTKTSEEIREKNTEINKKIEEKKVLKKEDIRHEIHHIHKFFDKDTLKGLNDVLLQIYDIPGINDRNNEDLYLDYLTETLPDFDIVIYMVDINSSFNTKNETVILERICNHIAKYNNTHLIIVLNKCDRISCEDGKIDFDDEEYKELFDQAKKTITDISEQLKIKDYVKHINILCSEDMYTYRALKQNPELKLDKKYINKIGENARGKHKWRELSEKEKKEVIKEASLKYDTNMKICGFTNFLESIEEIMSHDKNKSVFFMKRLKDLMFPHILKPFIENYENEAKLWEYAFVFSKKYNCTLIDKEFFIRLKLETHKREILNATQLTNSEMRVTFLENITNHHIYKKILTGEQFASGIKKEISIIKTAQNEFYIKKINTIEKIEAFEICLYSLLKNNYNVKIIHKIIMEHTSKKLSIDQNIYNDGYILEYVNNLSKRYELTTPNLIDILNMIIFTRIQRIGTRPTNKLLYLSNLKYMMDGAKDKLHNYHVFTNLNYLLDNKIFEIRYSESTTRIFELETFYFCYNTKYIMHFEEYYFSFLIKNKLLLETGIKPERIKTIFDTNEPLLLDKNFDKMMKDIKKQNDDTSLLVSSSLLDYGQLTKNEERKDGDLATITIV